MAKVQCNSALSGLSGTIGDCVFRRHRHGTVVQLKSARRRRWNARQRATQATFGGGSMFAAQIKADPALRQAYAARGRRHRLNFRQMAIRDYFHPPNIVQLDASGYTKAAGGTLRVLAADDFDVVCVKLVVCDANGAVLTFGDATAGANWMFAVPPPAPGAAPPARVQVTAFDRPGNFDTRSFSL